MFFDINKVQILYFCTSRALACNMSSSTYPHVLIQIRLCPPWHTDVLKPGQASFSNHERLK